MEKSAFIMFNARLSHLNDYFGKRQFENKLSSILEEQWPTAKVIETSPLFSEKVLNLVEQQYLKNDIAATIGLSHPDWKKFSRVMTGVTLMVEELRSTENKHGGFTRITEKLQKTVLSLPFKKMNNKNLTEEEAATIKARAVTRLANMYIYLDFQSGINAKILAYRVQAAKKMFTMNLIRYGAVALLIASTAGAGPVIAMAGIAARSLVMTDLVVAAQLAKIGNILAGGALGVVGAPAGYVVTSTSAAIREAHMNSLNNGTVYACELDKKFTEWRQQGASPYMKAAVKGGALGLLGGALTLTKAGAQVVLYGTTFGVSVGQLYSLHAMNENTMRGLAEYRIAVMSQENGNNEVAREHLKKSREYFALAGEKRVESLVIGILSVSLAAGDFKAALTQGEDMIRVMYANSSDTLPQAFQSAAEVVVSFADGK